MTSLGAGRVLHAGAFAAAITASICCFGPLALAVLGLGGGALLLRLEPFRPYALGAAILFLGAAFVLVYRTPPVGACEVDSACVSAPTLKRQRIALWILTLIVALAGAFPYLSKWLFV